MITPTATSIKMKFPEFAGLADGVVEFAIEESMLSFGDATEWTSEADRSIAVMYLVGHHLMVTISRAQSGTGQRIKSESMGGMSITYADDGVKPDLGDYTTTSYGSRYLDLATINVPAIGII
jgi:hypothetical protein